MYITLKIDLILISNSAYYVYYRPTYEYFLNLIKQSISKFSNKFNNINIDFDLDTSKEYTDLFVECDDVELSDFIKNILQQEIDRYWDVNSGLFKCWGGALFK